MYKGKVVSVLN